MVHIILLSGGSGTRLWPLSNETRSKQFLKVLRDEEGNRVSMVQRVVSQIRKTGLEVDLLVATSKSQEENLRSQLSDDVTLVLEPERRDTAPAILLSSAFLLFEREVSLSDTIVVMPIDSFVDQEFFSNIERLDETVRGGFADIMLLGVKPSCPSEKYGYIVPEEAGKAASRVSRFVEKPKEDLATSLIESGALWNCGVFAFSAEFVKRALASYLDADSFDEVASSYSVLPRRSFDYEVVETSQSVGVIEYAGRWKDLGTWNTLTEEMELCSSGRVVVDPDTTQNVHAINETGLPMVVAGLKDAVVIATSDGILATTKEASDRLKPLIESVAESRPMYERRFWGEYRVLDHSSYPDGVRALTKELVIMPGRQISYQRHLHRAEIWTVVSGSGTVVLDGESLPVSGGSVIQIGSQTLHSIKADTKMSIIEVQLGSELTEDDIERFGYYWD